METYITISIILSLIISIIYNYTFIYKYGIPESLSATGYIFPKSLFTLYIFSLLILLPGILEKTTYPAQIFIFLTFAGLLFAGASPEYKKSLTRIVHYGGAYLAFAAFIIYLIISNYILLIIYLIALISLIIYKKDSYVYFAEILALLTILIQLSI